MYQLLMLYWKRGTYLSIITMLAMLQPVIRGEINIGMLIALMSAIFGLSQDYPGV
jgi:hypothetical protein